MKPQKIKKITDAVKIPCLVGIRAFEEDVQQFTCKRFNGDICLCHKEYLKAIEKLKIEDI